jgi:ankyrin repeat protein
LPAAATEPSAATYELKGRRGSTRIDVDPSGIACTDNAGQRFLRWTDVRVVTQRRGTLTLSDGARLTSIAIPNKIDDGSSLLDTIANRLADAHATRMGRAGAPKRDVTFRQRRLVPLTLLAGAAGAAAVCAFLSPIRYLEAMFAVVVSLGYLAALPNRIVVGPDEIEMTTPLRFLRAPARAICDVRLRVFTDRDPTVGVRLRGDKLFELRGFGVEALNLYDALRRVIQPATDDRTIAIERRLAPRRALVFLSASIVLVALLGGLPIWNGRALSSTVRFDSPAVVRLLLWLGAPVEGHDTEGRTATYNAAKFGRVDNLLVMLAHGGNPAARSFNAAGHTPLHVAAEYDQLEPVRLLLAAGARPNVLNNWQQTPLHQLILLGHRRSDERRIVEVLLAAGADVDAADNQGFTPLIVLAAHPELGYLVPLLVGRSAHPNLQNANGATAFSRAVYFGTWPMVRALVAAGVDPDSHRPGENTWLRFAVDKKHLVMLRELLDAGARHDVVGTDGYFPLQIAAYQGDVDTIKLLVAAGADVEATTPDQPSALYRALEGNHIDAVHALLDLGASPTPEYKGWTPLQRAAYYGDLPTITLLLAAGVGPNQGTTETPPALLVAAGEGHLDAVRALIDGGADVNAAFGRWTPMTIAQRRQSAEMQQVLRDHGAR